MTTATGDAMALDHGARYTRHIGPRRMQPEEMKTMRDFYGRQTTWWLSAIWTKTICCALIVALLTVTSPPDANAQTGSTEWSQLGADIDGDAVLIQTGSSVALSADGTRLVVGSAAPSSSQRNTSRVRVYQLTDGDWEPLGDDILGVVDGTAVGRSVAISDDGSTLVVGFSKPGRARVYRFANGVWGQIGANIDTGDAFTPTVDVGADGITVAVGAPADGGKVNVYRLVGGAWTQFGNQISGQPGSFFGREIAMSAAGNRIAIADSDHLVGATEVLGRVRVYELRLQPIVDEFRWFLMSGDLIGRTNDLAMASDGETLIVGQPQDNLARVFTWTGLDWEQLGGDLVGEQPNDFAGNDVAVSEDGERVAVGAVNSSNTGGLAAGHVRIFDLVGGTWVQAAPAIDGESSGDESGGEIALSADGNILAIGAIRNDGGGVGLEAGHVRVFSAIGAQDDQVALVAPASASVDVLSNDSAPADSLVTVEVIAEPDQGSTTVEDDFTITYLPGVSTETSDSFDYQLCVDETCRTATVSITITPPTCRRRSVVPLVATIWGTNGDDLITGTTADDVIVSFGGEDTVNGGDGDNTICLGDGDDTVTTGSGRDFVRGGPGVDTVNTGLGIDRLWGDAGNDILSGEGGSDRIRGGLGDDLVKAGSGADRVWGGPGNDTLNGQGGQDFMWGDSGNDQMQGNFQSDRMWGGNGDDTIRGAEGKDRIYGEAGNDQMFGGNNTDLLEGGPGIDSANGQKGKDNPYIPDTSGCNAETKLSC